MSELNAIVAGCGTHAAAQEAVKTLRHAGIDMRKLSVVGKDSRSAEQVVGYCNSGDRKSPEPGTALYMFCRTSENIVVNR